MHWAVVQFNHISWRWQIMANILGAYTLYQDAKELFTYITDDKLNICSFSKR